MKKIWLKILACFVILCTFAGSICGIVYSVKYSNAKVDSQELAEHQDIVNNLNGQIEDLNEQIESLEEEISTYEDTIEDNNSLIAQLEEEKNSLIAERDNLIAEKEAIIVDYEGALSEKEQEIEDLNTSISYLNEEINALEQTNTSLQNTINSLQSQINSQSTTIAELQSEINRLNGLLDSYADLISQTYEVTYYVNGYIYTAQAVRAGQCPAPVEVPTLDNYRFKYWTTSENGNEAVDPMTVSIFEDTSFYANIELYDFGQMSWDTIAEISEEGIAPEVFNVGDEKIIYLSTWEEVTFVILGFNHDDLTSGGKAGITIGTKNALATAYQMNLDATNAGGWDASVLRTSTMATLLSQLPADLQQAIKFVNKKTTAGEQSKTITISSDKLFLFSEVEIDATTTAGFCDEGSQYEYWRTVKNGKVTAGRKLSDGTGSACNWWLRSPLLSDGSYFRNINAYGDVMGRLSSAESCVVFGFCI